MKYRPMPAGAGSSDQALVDASVDLYDRAGDIAGPFRAQERSECRELLWISQSLERCRFSHNRVYLFYGLRFLLCSDCRQTLQPLGQMVARTQRVDCYAKRANLLGQALEE